MCIWSLNTSAHVIRRGPRKWSTVSASAYILAYQRVVGALSIQIVRTVIAGPAAPYVRSTPLDEIRELLRRRRDDYPEWELKRDGQIIGWIRAFHMRTSSTLFYRATGILRPLMVRVNLENSPNFQERVEVVQRFWEDPELWRGVHWR